MQTLDTSSPTGRFSGLRISPGLAMGRAYVVGDAFAGRGLKQPIAESEVEEELRKLRVAFDKTRSELNESAHRVEEQFNFELAEIFRAHQIMLDGFLSSGEFAQEMRSSLVNASTVARRVFRRWQKKFQALNDETFRQRADDIVDIGRKLLRHLEGDPGFGLTNLPDGSVLVVERLLPSDVVTLSRRHTAAILVESLGYGSHAALLAREKSIPTIADLAGITERVRDGDEILVDALRGEVVICPDTAQRFEFEERWKAHDSSRLRCHGSCHAPALTLDGERVVVEANLGTDEDAELAVENGADGVGLFRIEQLYLARDLPPSEDELLVALRRATELLRDKPLTIRLLDIGGDKPVPFVRFPSEANPLLGTRGVRVLLEYPQLTQTQLVAILRLSQERPVRVLVPMVTIEEDIRAIRRVFDELCGEHKIRQPPPFGAMIETPAAALSVPVIARHVDFLCVGTNDLTQYTLAVGRDDPAVNRYYLDSHVSLVRLLKIVVDDAGDMPLTLCGELAGREEMIPQLLTMGFRSLSVAPLLIPGAKERIRSVSLHPFE
ncbi:MAG TPA: phosphoenolpyruvate--protein phosphotransferase [Candidatus Acidoferrales bacterium]|nr:phosphoenolpyruvate--protein phosphotransferase [Candidatus Acidoferrales bacterium]